MSKGYEPQYPELTVLTLELVSGVLILKICNVNMALRMQSCKPLVLKTRSYKLKALKIQFISLWSLEYHKDANSKAVIHCL